MNRLVALITIVVVDVVSYVLLVGAAYGVHGAFDKNFWLTIAVGVFGVVIGWFLGFLASPATDNERRQFTDYAGVISTFASGYLLSKLDPVVTEGLKNTERFSNVETQLNLMVFGACLLSGAMVMYLLRAYVSGSCQRPPNAAVSHSAQQEVAVHR